MRSPAEAEGLMWEMRAQLLDERRSGWVQSHRLPDPNSNFPAGQVRSHIPRPWRFARTAHKEGYCAVNRLRTKTVQTAAAATEAVTAAAMTARQKMHARAPRSGGVARLCLLPPGPVAAASARPVRPSPPAISLGLDRPEMQAGGRSSEGARRSEGPSATPCGRRRRLSGSSGGGGAVELRRCAER